jgi:hypothetical protein
MFWPRAETTERTDGPLFISDCTRPYDSPAGLRKITRALHERAGVVQTGATSVAETVSTEAFGRVFGSRHGVAGVGTTLSTGLDSVALGRPQLECQGSVGVSLTDNAVGSPASRKLYGGGDNIGVGVPADCIGPTTDLGRVASAWHFAFTREQSVGCLMSVRAILHNLHRRCRHSSIRCRILVQQRQNRKTCTRQCMIQWSACSKRFERRGEACLKFPGHNRRRCSH